VSRRSGPSVLDFTLATSALLLLPVTVVAFFAFQWWIAFIPLVFVIGCLIVIILAHMWRMFRDFKRQVSTL
jgi:hypothetical protein